MADNEFVLFHLQAVGRKETASCLAENVAYAGNLSSLEHAITRLHKEHDRLRKSGGAPLTTFLAAPFRYPVGCQKQRERRYDSLDNDFSFGFPNPINFRQLLPSSESVTLEYQICDRPTDMLLLSRLCNLRGK